MSKETVKKIAIVLALFFFVFYIARAIVAKTTSIEWFRGPSERQAPYAGYFGK
ncbi:MAG: hypothetical protein KBC26_00735 [Candidatus Pacebacteria bacterium]|nr:hypothetical protein [Candidatus Paceibacterota bacterium]